MSRKLLLVSNPGSSSRKYALYTTEGDKLLDCIARVHFETNQQNQIVYTLLAGDKPVVDSQPAGISHVTFSVTKLIDILTEHSLLGSTDHIGEIGLRVVAPSTFFQQHHKMNPAAVNELKKMKHQSSLHVNTVLQEIELLEKEFPSIQIVGVSDSAFHVTMPDYARTYGISQADAKQAEVWRFGYHGLSMSSVVRQLSAAGPLPKRVVVCHLGSGCSVTALLEGKSIETSMGYSPTEGLVMATRSGSIDLSACNDLSSVLGLTKDQLEKYLSHQSGLLGLSGTTSDIRELLELEANGHREAQLALDVFVYHIQLAIGQMSAALGDCDALVFTGTIGERSSEIRSRVMQKLQYLGVSNSQGSKPVIILGTDESYEIANIVLQR